MGDLLLGCVRLLLGFPALKAGKAKIYTFGNNLMGQAAGGVNEVEPAGDVVRRVVEQAAAVPPWFAKGGKLFTLLCVFRALRAGRASGS